MIVVSLAGCGAELPEDHRRRIVDDQAVFVDPLPGELAAGGRAVLAYVDDRGQTPVALPVGLEAFGDIDDGPEADPDREVRIVATLPPYPTPRLVKVRRRFMRCAPALPSPGAIPGSGTGRPGGSP